MKRWILLSFALLLMLSACAPSEAEMQATVTQVAAELYGTQTALAPTATITLTPTITPTPTTTATATLPPTITNTPHPPTATLTEAGVEKLMLCYKAAVSIQADWEVHLLISGTGKILDGWYNPANIYKSRDLVVQELNAFLWERSQRAGGIQILDKNAAPLGNDTLVVDGVEIESKTYGREDCDPYLGTIIASNDNLSFGPYGIGAYSRLSTAHEGIKKVVEQMRTELLKEYSVDSAELEAIENPIWQFMRNRYGEPLHEIPMMR